MKSKQLELDYSFVVKARHLGGHRVWLRFRDGLEGEIDLAGRLQGPVFEPLHDPAYFACFSVNDTLCWPNGADFSPEYLWDRVRYERFGIKPTRRYVRGFLNERPLAAAGRRKAKPRKTQPAPRKPSRRRA